MQPTIFTGTNNMQFFRRIFGPVVAVTSCDYDDAIGINTLWLGCRCVEPRQQHRPIRPGGTSRPAGCRVNCYHLYPAHAAFSSHKQSASAGRATR